MPGVTKPKAPVSGAPIVTKGTQIAVGCGHAFLRDRNSPGERPKSPNDGEQDEEETVEPFEPQVDFKPVIQLAQMVKPPTETDTDHVLFETRAKAFRAQTDPTTHSVTEWKERGTGTFRLLMCRTTGKVRVVMRREGTHKVCLNHHLSPEIAWQYAFNSTTAVTWHTPAEASDVDKQPEHAILALRVKREDTIKELLDKVNECREWNAKLATGKEKAGSARAPKPIERNEKEDGATASKDPFRAAPQQSVASAQDTSDIVRASRPGRLEEEEVVEEYEPKAQFEPVVRLDHTVSVPTGEEGETVSFSERAVLFRYDPAAQVWKERGAGTLRILTDPSTSRSRIVMRRDKVHKVCANHLITREMKLEPFVASKQSMGRTFMWLTLADISENDSSGNTEPMKETLAARFATSQRADSFKDAFAKAQQLLTGVKSETNVSETSSESTTPTAQRKTSVQALPKGQPAQPGSFRDPSPGRQAQSTRHAVNRPESPASVAASPTAKVISLPASRDVSPVRIARTQPRQESLVFSDLAHCYKYVPSKSKWLVLGRGALEMFQSADQPIRIQMALDPSAISVPTVGRSGACRIAFNHYIKSGMQLTPHGPGAWMWFSRADGELGVPAIVGVRFASVQDAQEFKAKWDECEKWTTAQINGKQAVAMTVGPCKALAKTQSRDSSPSRNSVLDERALERLADNLGDLPPLDGQLLCGAFQPNQHVAKHIASPTSTLRSVLAVLESKCATLSVSDICSHLQYVSQTCPWIGGTEFVLHLLTTKTYRDTKTALADAHARLTRTLDACQPALTHHLVSKIRHKDTLLVLGTDPADIAQAAIDQALVAAAKVRKNLHVTRVAPGPAASWDVGTQLVRMGVTCTPALPLADVDAVGARLVLVPATRVLHDGSPVVPAKLAAVLRLVAAAETTHVLVVSPAACVSPNKVVFVSQSALHEEEQVAAQRVPASLVTAVVTEQGAVVPLAVKTVFERAAAKAALESE